LPAVPRVPDRHRLVPGRRSDLPAVGTVCDAEHRRVLMVASEDLVTGSRVADAHLAVVHAGRGQMPTVGRAVRQPEDPARMTGETPIQPAGLRVPDSDGP